MCWEDVCWQEEDEDQWEARSRCNPGFDRSGRNAWSRVLSTRQWRHANTVCKMMHPNKPGKVVKKEQLSGTTEEVGAAAV